MPFDERQIVLEVLLQLLMRARRGTDCETVYIRTFLLTSAH